MFYDLFNKLCKEKGVSVTKATVDIGLSRTIGTKWKNTAATPQGETLNKIAAYFDVSTDYLLGNDQKENAPALNKRDERDIAKKLNEMLDQLGSSEEALMFDGETLDEETRELLRASLKNQLEMTKKIAKQKYTPKHRK